MSAAPHDRQVCSTQYVLEPTSGGDVATILQAFDVLRRRTSERLHGVEGAFLGYDHLAISTEALARVVPDAICTSTAVLRRSEGNRHLVEYLATASPSPASGEDVGCEEVIRGHGWTLAVSPRADGSHGDPAPRLRG